MQNIIDAYNKHKNLKLAANELGIKWQTLYVQLKKLDVKITGDKLKYGSDKDRLAAQAELLFQKIVPFAENNNLSKFQSKIDFTVNGQKVDIKASKLNKGCINYESKRWAFSIKKQELIADFIVAFAFDENVKLVKIYLIPSEMIRNYQTISIGENSRSKWNQFEISEQDLLEFFNEFS